MAHLSLQVHPPFWPNAMCLSQLLQNGQAAHLRRKRLVCFCTILSSRKHLLPLLKPSKAAQPVAPFPLPAGS